MSSNNLEKYICNACGTIFESRNLVECPECGGKKEYCTKYLYFIDELNDKLVQEKNAELIKKLIAKLQEYIGGKDWLPSISSMFMMIKDSIQDVEFYKELIKDIVKLIENWEKDIRMRKK